MVDALFVRADTRRAASAFLDWFIMEKGGRATKGEMSKFATDLADGAPGCRLSRPSFYRSVLEAHRTGSAVG
jgi:hypothetical protein